MIFIMFVCFCVPQFFKKNKKHSPIFVNIKFAGQNSQMLKKSVERYNNAAKYNPFGSKAMFKLCRSKRVLHFVPHYHHTFNTAFIIIVHLKIYIQDIQVRNY